MSDEPPLMAQSSLNEAIHLRWVLRDIKAKRLKLTPVGPEDLRNLLEMGLIEIRDEAPLLTSEGERSINWN